MKRRIFGYITAKIYGGKGKNKTLGIHLKNKDKTAITLSRTILEAVECGADIDITIFKDKPLKNGKTRITITSRYERKRE